MQLGTFPAQALGSLANPLATSDFVVGLLDAMSTNVAILDGEGTIVATNAGWQRYSSENGGDPAHCGVGVNYLRVCERARGTASQGSATVSRRLAELLQGETREFSVEYDGHAADAEHWWVARFTRFTVGPQTFVFVVHADATERRRAQEALRARERHLTSILESAYEGVWTINRDAETDYVNPRMAQMLGYDPREMLGRPFFDFMDSAGVADAVTRLRGWCEGERDQHELRFIRKDGTSLWTQVTTSVLTDEQGRYAGALAMVSDLTSLKEAERMLHEREVQYRSLIGQRPELDLTPRSTPKIR
jgi:PAS domain S-box-containing protein